MPGRPLRSLSGLGLRAVSGLTLAAVLGVAVWTGPPGVTALVVVAAAVGAWEYRGLMARIGPAPPPWLLYPLTLWLAVRVVLPLPPSPLEVGLGAAVVVGLLAMVLIRLPMLAWASAVGGALYLGLTLGYYVALSGWRVRDHAFGSRLLTAVLLAVIAGDVAAFFVGSAIGRRPFFAALSPRKTAEGALAGLAGSVAASLLLGLALVGLQSWQALALGLLIAVAAQGGDLAASALKRQASVKDSSSLVPGHGGLLDRLDSLLLVGPVVYFFLRLIILP